MELVKLSGICGVIGPVASLPLLFQAISMTTGFSWFGNWLSDLGGGVFGPSVSTIFNLSPILGGIFGLIFSLGLYKAQSKPSGRLGSLLFILASISLVAIGVFPEPFGLIHYSVSAAFFTLSPLSMFYIGASAMDSSDISLATLSFSLGLISAIAMVPILRATSEFVSAASTSVWTIYLGIRLLSKGSF